MRAAWGTGHDPEAYLRELRAKFGVGARIFIQTMYAESAFRQMGWTWTARVTSRTVSGNFSLSNSTFSSGGEGPRGWGLVVGAVQEAQMKLTVRTALDSPAAAVETAGVLVAVRNGCPVAILPVEWNVPPAEGHIFRGS